MKGKFNIQITKPSQMTNQPLIQKEGITKHF